MWCKFRQSILWRQRLLHICIDEAMKLFWYEISCFRYYNNVLIGHSRFCALPDTPGNCHRKPPPNPWSVFLPGGKFRLWNIYVVILFPFFRIDLGSRFGAFHTNNTPFPDYPNEKRKKITSFQISTDHRSVKACKIYVCLTWESMSYLK